MSWLDTRDTPRLMLYTRADTSSERNGAMRPRSRATIEDLYKVEGKEELANREIVEMPPSGDDPGYASGEIFATLRAYVRRTRRGRAYGDGVGFHVNLPHRESFSPDAAYHVGPRAGMRFLEGRPSLRSKSAVRTTTARRWSRRWRRNEPTTSPVERRWCGM